MKPALHVPIVRVSLIGAGDKACDKINKISQGHYVNGNTISTCVIDLPDIRFKHI